ncbi:MAG: glycosyltransferase family 1 protein [Sphingobacteriia bacterium]|nr:glycosyltransferase family 1 protein [Sphingobacteriia bacterium]NCC39595.1 glycosyltransferase family 1 protein [Gammaproteobacteria bacterium]
MRPLRLSPARWRRARAAWARHGGLWGLVGRLIALARGEGLVGLRQRLVGLVRGARAPSRALGPSKDAPRATLAPGVLLVGHPFIVLGRAEDIRTAACALDAAAVPFGMLNLYGDHGREWAGLQRDFPFMDRLDPTTDYRVNLFVLNADEMAMAARELGEARFAGRYNIGYWAWELSHFPDAWLPALAGLDEIWAPSRFIQQAIAEKTRRPVIWMPLAVEARLTLCVGRAALGLPESAFLFLVLFDFRAFLGRKNPMAAIQAFARAFACADQSVALVIKTTGMAECPQAHADFKVSPLMEDPRIRLIDRLISDQELKSLINACDCFVSLHRCEGFGRGLAEAMALGKPVIATGYSGNLDFMNPSNACLVDAVLVPVGAGEYPYGEGQVWAEADVEMAADFMRRLAADPLLASEIGARARRDIQRHNSFAAVGARYRRRLEQLGLLSTCSSQADLASVVGADGDRSCSPGAVPNNSGR